jgi:hypothetical protein
MKKSVFKPVTISEPIKTGSIGDNLSLSFSITRKMLAHQWHLMLVMAFFAGITTIGFNILIKNLGFDLPESSSLDNVTGSIKTIPAYIILYIFLLNRFSVMIHASEAFEDIPKRKFAAVFGYFLLNYLLTIFLMAIITVPFFITIVIPLVGPFIFMFILPIFLLLILYFIAIASQPLIYSYFKKIYPIRAWKFSVKGVFSRAGHRRGGLFGLNIWHFIGVCLLASLINVIVAALIYAPTLYLSSTIVPSDIPYLKHITTSVTVMISMCVYYVIYYFTFTTSAVYVSELLAFGENDIREEIASRASR